MRRIAKMEPIDKRLIAYLSLPDEYSDILDVFVSGINSIDQNIPFEFIAGTQTLSKVHPCPSKKLKLVPCGKNADALSRAAKCLSSVPQKYVLLMHPDTILTGKIDLDYIQNVLNYMGENGILSCTYQDCHHKGWNKYPCEKQLDLFYINRKTHYGLNLFFGIFDKQYLLNLFDNELLHKGNIWHIEKSWEQSVINTSTPSYFDKHISFNNKKAIPFVHAVIKGTWIKKAKRRLIKSGVEAALFQNRNSKSYFLISIIRLFVYKIAYPNFIAHFIPQKEHN